MPAYVALLRGINVGGKHLLPMAKVRETFEDAGAKSVETYIQSGNVVFKHPQRSANQLGKQLASALEEAAGFAVPVIVRSAVAWGQAINIAPFTDPEVLHCAFLPERKITTPEYAKLHAIDWEACLPSRFQLQGSQVYLHLPAGIGRDKLAGAVLRVFPDATVRNWRTVMHLSEMLAKHA